MYLSFNLNIIFDKYINVFIYYILDYYIFDINFIIT